MICQLSVVQWMGTFIFGVLICLVRPHSTGSVTMCETDTDTVQGSTESKDDLIRNKMATKISKIEIGWLNRLIILLYSTVVSL